VDPNEIEFVNWQGFARAGARKGALERVAPILPMGRSGRGLHRSRPRIVVPANDGLPTVPRKAAERADPLFRLDLVEVDGLVLLASRLRFGQEAFRAMRRARGARAAQLTVNTVFLDEFLEVSDYSRQALAEFGCVVRDCLRFRAERDFPDLSFVADLVRTGLDRRLGIRLYQVILADGEREEDGGANAI